MSWKHNIYEEDLKDMYDAYTWNPKIGPYGGFSYRKGNNFIDILIDVPNIGKFKRCDVDKKFSSKSLQVELFALNYLINIIYCIKLCKNE